MTKNEALKIIDDSPVRPGQRWQHAETQATYTIVAVGLDEPTLEPVVNYAGPDGVVWTRQLSVFLGEKAGKPRFVQTRDESESGTTAPFEKTSWRPIDGFEERPS